MLPSLFIETTPAILVLADGTIFNGYSVGAAGHTVGEVVFNTSMSGYQEILSDPSYYRQLVTFTYPHIGNTGVNAEDDESAHHHASGMIVRDYPNVVSNFRSTDTLKNYLVKRGIVAIAGIDTRKLTRLLREKGSQVGCILVGEDIARAQQLVAEFSGLAGLDLAKEVSTTKAYEWTQGTWDLHTGFSQPDVSKFHVVAYDYGVKQNILRLIADRGCKVTVVPAQTPIQEVLALNPDGVFLSNGPGDPEPCDYAIEAVKVLIEKKVPTFGICLGHQILGLAAGGKTRKMKFGHHGANHPVQDLGSKRVYITTQNHGFEVDASTLPDNVRVTHVSLFDGSLQGIELVNAPAFSFQGHPEASSGPQDIVALFDKFAALMQAQKNV